MKPYSYQHNNKRSEILNITNGYTINFYEDNVLVHYRNINHTENPHTIAEDFVHDGDSAPKLLRD